MTINKVGIIRIFQGSVLAQGVKRFGTVRTIKLWNRKTMLSDSSFDFKQTIACGVNRPIFGIFHNKQIDVENTSLVKNGDVSL